MKTAAIILAAGKGTRMKSDLPKVIHKVNGKSMIKHVVETSEAADLDPIIIVIGHKKELVVAEIGEKGTFAVQEEQRGTGSAVAAAEMALSEFEGNVVILCGDTPLIKKETILDLINLHQSEKASGTILTAKLDNPFAYGRIVRRNDGSVEKITEEKDATDEEKKINEINSGAYCFNKKDLFEALKEVNDDNNQHELYLTDVVEILNRKGKKVAAYPAKDWREIIGVNSIDDLNDVEKILSAHDSVS